MPSNNLSINSQLAVSYLFWGLSPIYWSALGELSAITIVALRVILSAATVAAACLLMPSLKINLPNKRHFLVLTCSSLFLLSNWVLYIWGITEGYVFECGTGYFICPLLFVAYGVIRREEQLTTSTAMALLIAAAGVISAIISYGSVPWLSLGLALSFLLYGIVHRNIPTRGIENLFIESLIASPIAIALLIYQPLEFTSIATRQIFLVAAIGAVTLAPLLLFTRAVKQANILTTGMLQNINPICQITLGIWWFRETILPETKLTALAAAVALIVYLAGAFIHNKANQQLALSPRVDS